MPSPTRPMTKSQKAFKAIESSSDEVHFLALRVPLHFPSHYTEKTLLYNQASFDSAIRLVQDGPYYLHPCFPPSRKPEPGGWVLEWELRQLEYQHWRGKYSVWYWKGQDEFWVCRHGEGKYDGEQRKRVLTYDSVPRLDRRYENEGIADFLGHVARWLREHEGM